MSRPTLKTCGEDNDHGGRPLYVDGDGNCLNSAVSGLSVGWYTFAADGTVRANLSSTDPFPHSRYELWKVSLDVCVKPGLHSVRRTYATEMRKRIYADTRIMAFTLHA